MLVVQTFGPKGPPAAGTRCYTNYLFANNSGDTFIVPRGHLWILEIFETIENLSTTGREKAEILSLLSGAAIRSMSDTKDCE